MQVAHQLQHALLAALGEVFFNIQLTDSLAQHATYGAHATFPARTVLCNAAEHRAKLECCCAEVVAQCACSAGDNARLGIGFQIVEGRFGQHLFNLMNGFGLTHVNAVEGREALGQEQVAPIDAREVGYEVGVCHLMIVGVDVAQLHVVVAGLC